MVSELKRVAMVRLISVRSRRSARRGVLLGGSGPTPFRGHAALTKAAPPISNPDVSTIFTSACAAITGLAGTYPSPPPKRPGQVGGDGTRGHESLLQVGFSPDGPVNAHPWMSTNFTRLLANRHPDLGDSLRRCKPLFKYGYCKIVLLGAWLMLVVRWENHRPQRVDLDSTIGSVVFGAGRFAHSGEES